KLTRTRVIDCAPEAIAAVAHVNRVFPPIPTLLHNLLAEGIEINELPFTNHYPYILAIISTGILNLLPGEQARPPQQRNAIKPRLHCLNISSSGTPALLKSWRTQTRTWVREQLSGTFG